MDRIGCKSLPLDMDPTDSPSDILRLADDYFQTVVELDACLREAFTALSGAQLMLRTGNVLLNSSSWPSQSKACYPTDAASDDREQTLRDWLGGSCPTRDVREARQHFTRALEISHKLQILKTKLSLQLA